MSRGQHRGIRGLKTAPLMILLAGIFFAVMCRGAGAAISLPSATVQPHRIWENYFGVTIRPTGRAVVVGDKGLVMITDDGGHTWTRQNLQSGLKYYDLYSVAFTSDGSHGWVVGDHATIFRTDDGGVSWHEEKAPGSGIGALLKIAVADDQRACAGSAHGAILCTNDGGSTWQVHQFKDIAFFDLVFEGPNNGWAVGEFETILHTTDGGRNWTTVRGGDRMGTLGPLFALAFHGGEQGVAVGMNGSALRTDGKSWQPQELSVNHRTFYTVAAVPSAAGEFYAAGENGAAALITNGKVMPINTGSSDAISAVAFSPRFALAVGLGGTILRSDDGGHHWYPLNDSGQTLQTRAQ